MREWEVKNMIFLLQMQKQLGADDYLDMSYIHMQLTGDSHRKMFLGEKTQTWFGFVLSYRLHLIEYFNVEKT